MKISKTQLKKNISQQTINGETIYYSYAEKSQATLSILKNQRLLIFNSKNGTLYYINQPKSVPFLTEIPKPKNQCANIDISIVRNPPSSSQLIIEFAMKNQKNQQLKVEWQFVFQTKSLAQQWLKTIQEYKANKLQEAISQNNKQSNIQSNAFIHDTLGFGALQGLKKSQQFQPRPQLRPELNQSNIRQSQSNIKSQKQQLLRPENTQKNISNSNINQMSRENLGTSNVQGSNVKQVGYQEEKPSIRESNLQRSNLNKNQLSPQGKRSRLNEDLGKSKLTLRDQLESILQRSYLRQSKFESIHYNQRSRIVKESNYDPDNDWNLKFLKQQDENILLDFQIFAQKSFFSILAEDDQINESLRCYIRSGIIILVANSRSDQAKKLKAEFRNYHFIMQSCKSQLLVGVPLACLIEFQGLVSLVKSSIPDHAEKLQLTQSILLDLKDLQRYTRIKNNILGKASLFDLSDIYDSKGRKLIFIDNLFEYLPIHLDQNFRGSSLRPEHILDNVNNFMQGGVAHEANRNDMKILNESLDKIRAHVGQLAKELSTQDIIFANPIQLKTVMHQRGINLKYLPLLYNEVTNKNVKKYINTIMVAKVVKDNLIQNVAAMRTELKQTSNVEIIENSFKLLLEGNTNVSNQFWKEISINFRKDYGIPMSNHDILGSFFLNCLMKLIPAKYDLSKLNDKKTFFKEQGIINKGFVVQLLPKTKSFYRYTSELTDKIDYTCKQEKLKENFEAIVDELQFKSKSIPRIFYLSKVDEPLKQYLSYFACPSQFDSRQFSHLNLFQKVGIEPPTTLSLMITKNYLDWCLDREKHDQFKRTLQETLLMIDFWFGQNHLYHCQFYESLSNYYELTGAIDQSINFMKQSLAISIRSGGVTSKKTGFKYYELAEKQLRAGRKNDSMQNFIKAKSNMQNYNDESIKYPITLMKLSSLYLNASQFQNCIIFSKQAIERFEAIQAKNKSASIHVGTYDQYCIKAIEIMTRAFQIENKKNQFYKIAQLASVKYNKTKNPYVFEQLMKICLTAVISKHIQQKCKIFESFVEKLGISSESQASNPQKCLDQLMLLAEQFNVMERFMFKFESLERIVSDINSRRTLSQDSKQFIAISKNMVGCIGQDYVYGLIQQKQFQ